MWAKAPIASGAAEKTEADRRSFLSEGLRPVECTTCGTCVLVKKNSKHHTSIQWQTSTDNCPEFASLSKHGDGEQRKPAALLDTCSKLRASIESLVAEGLIEVPDG